MDLLRSLMAAAFGLGRTSSIEIFGGKSSKLGMLSRVGEVAGEEPWEVINVRWPEDTYENRWVLSLRLSSCRPSCDLMLLVIER